MYQMGDLVVYGIHGVCRIAQQEERIVDKKTVTYLALEPVGQGGSRYLVPTYNAAAMSKLRHILSKEELEESINFTLDKPIGLGRKGDLVANTPTRLFPPSLGGLTVADQFFRTALENFHRIHI